MKMAKKSHELTIDFDDLLDQAMVLGSSLVYLARDSADDIVTELEKRDLLSSDEGRKMANDLKDEFSTRKAKLQSKVKTHLTKIIDELGIATKEDLKKAK
jgi:polyhydroxyalkanoate synthesis regulator phasin